MRKILIIIGALRTGGAEKITVDFIENMNRTGLDIYFLVFGEEIGNYESRAINMGCQVIHAQRSGVPYISYYKEMKRIWDFYGGFDCVHSHTLLNNGVNLFIFKKLGCKHLISHSHSTNSNRKENLKTRIYEVLMKWIIRTTATDYLACGEGAGEYLYGKKHFEEKGIIIYNGVDFVANSFKADIRQQVRQELHVESDFVIGHVARLTELKNHKFVLRILKELLKVNSRCKYIIVGDGPYRENIQKEIDRLDLQEKVFLLGNRNDVHRLQNAFDVVVFPSLFEGVPVALVEAQINGIPCIISESVSKEVRLAKETEFLSLELDEKIWASKVAEIFNVERRDNQLLEIGQEYDIRKSAQKLRSIYLH